MKKCIRIFAGTVLFLAFTFMSCQKEALPEPTSRLKSTSVIALDPLLQSFSSTVQMRDSMKVSLKEYVYHVSPASQMNLKFPAMTREQWRASLILAFMLSPANDSDLYHVVPGKGASGNYWMYKNDKEAETIIVFLSSQYSPVTSRDYNMAKVLILEPENKNDIFSRRKLIENLLKSGVDINDYQQIMQFFGRSNP